MKSRKSYCLVVSLILLSLVGGFTQAEPLGTAFTYQGWLVDGGSPAQGIYDLRFTIYDAATDGDVVSGPLTNTATGVTNGLFTATLDFGSGVFVGDASWIEVGVRTNDGGAFVPLTPRQPLTPAPHAVYAASAGSALQAGSAVLATNLAVPLPDDRLAGTYSESLVFANANNEFYGDLFGKAYGDFYGEMFGSIYGDGTGLDSLDAASLSIGTVPDARLSTNVARLTAHQIFTGTNTFAGALLATNPANLLRGAFAGNASGLTNLNGAAISAGSVTNAALAANAVDSSKVLDGSILAADVNVGSFSNTLWKVNGNAGTTGGTHFVGTTDNQPLEFRVNNFRVLRIEPNANGAPNVIGGAPVNGVAAGVIGATIGGGGVTNYFGSVYSNYAAGDFSTIAGGRGNIVQASATRATVSGGDENIIQEGAVRATIGGGGLNVIQTNAEHSTIGGGFYSSIGTDCIYATIAGGHYIVISNNATYGAIGGGYGHKMGSGASFSTIGGGYQNVIQTGGSYGTIPGGNGNTARGNYTFAAGYNASATNDGAFVWSDGTGTATGSTNNNSVTFRASGGYRLFTATGVAGVFLAAGSGSWTSMSDRNVKESFQPVNTREVLDKVAALPVTTWKYKSQDAAVRHIGPMAQDFRAAFAVGDSETGITGVDADGVALAAIQGLNEIVKEKEARIRDLEQTVAELKEAVTKLANQRGGGAR